MNALGRLVLIPIFILGAFSAKAQDKPLFRSAFPMDALKDVSRSDARISADFLIKEIVESEGYDADVQTPDSHTEMIEKVRNKEIEAFLLFTHRYVALEAELGMRPILIPCRQENDPKDRLMLVTKKGVLIDDIVNGTLLVQSGYGELIDIWTSTLQTETGLPISDRFSETEIKPNVKEAVLPVFFGKADAAVCMDKSLQLLNELNPHFQKNIDVVATSEPLISSVLCLSQHFTEKTEGTIERVGLDLHNSAKGRQLLTVMGVECFEPFQDSALDSIRSLMSIAKERKGETP
ncbi:MAG: PhnD/SsuA/transferrin family substrate-binding protein [Verrucomicrobiota bacterium]